MQRKMEKFREICKRQQNYRKENSRLFVHKVYRFHVDLSFFGVCMFMLTLVKQLGFDSLKSTVVQLHLFGLMGAGSIERSFCGDSDVQIYQSLI